MIEMTRTSALVVIVVLGARPRQTQAQSPPSSEPVGVWRGTSVCQVRPSPCNDETVVYRITRVKSTDTLSIDGRRIVSGQEQEMGVLPCRFAAPDTITCTIPSGVWRFTIRRDSLVGELRHPDGTKLRDVRTVRSR